MCKLSLVISRFNPRVDSLEKWVEMVGGPFRVQDATLPHFLGYPADNVHRLRFLKACPKEIAFINYEKR